MTGEAIPKAVAGVSFTGLVFPCPNCGCHCHFITDSEREEYHAPVPWYDPFIQKKSIKLKVKCHQCWDIQIIEITVWHIRYYSSWSDMRMVDP